MREIEKKLGFDKWIRRAKGGKVSSRSTEEKEALVRPEMVDYREHMKKERQYAWAGKLELAFELLISSKSPEHDSRQQNRTFGRFSNK